MKWASVTYWALEDESVGQVWWSMTLSILSTLETEARQSYAPSQPELYRKTVSDE